MLGLILHDGIFGVNMVYVYCIYIQYILYMYIVYIYNIYTYILYIFIALNIKQEIHLFFL